MHLKGRVPSDSPLGTIKCSLKTHSDRKRKYEYDEHVIEMNKMIKFGTNVDLSSDLWDKHISEINKLPYWLRLDDEHNPLSQGTLTFDLNLTSNDDHGFSWV